MDRLSYEFPVADGDYTVMLYFTEPWYGTGMKGDCSNWRNFDVAINNRTVLHHLDIWKEAGHDHALKKTFRVRAAEGKIKIGFPEITSGQAIIAAIAITSDHTDLTPAPAAQAAITLVETAGGCPEDMTLPDGPTWGSAFTPTARKPFPNGLTICSGQTGCVFPKHSPVAILAGVLCLLKTPVFMC